MNKTANFFSVLVFFLFIGLNSFCTELLNHIKELPGVISVESLNSNHFFSEKYLIYFEQDLDINKPEEGKFSQRIILNHKSYDAPTIFITEGYNANYALYDNYINELSEILTANQICVEHRYFSASAPDSLNWDYLTTENAANDHHKILETFKHIYKKKWISTGASKGGETCLLLQMYYPEDVDVTIAYVSPNAKALEDGRHEIFLKKVASAKERKKVLNFQKEVLKRRETIFPIFEQFVKDCKLTFRLPLEEIYDFCVLEYSFAFWQNLGDTDRIPSVKDSDRKIFNHFINIANPDYFAIERYSEILPFYYQAARELGYYGYDTNPLKKLLKISSAKGYFDKIFLSDDMKVEFEPSTSQNLEEFIKTKAKNTIIILGEYDPWTAAAPEIGNNPNVIKVINPKGTHASCIRLLPQAKRDMLISQINDWLKN